MNYKQRKIARHAKRESKKYHKDLYDEYFVKVENTHLIALNKGKKLYKYYEELKTYPYFKRKASKELRKVEK